MCSLRLQREASGAICTAAAKSRFSPTSPAARCAGPCSKLELAAKWPGFRWNVRPWLGARAGEDCSVCDGPQRNSSTYVT